MYCLDRRPPYDDRAGPGAFPENPRGGFDDRRPPGGGYDDRRPLLNDRRPLMDSQVPRGGGGGSFEGRAGAPDLFSRRDQGGPPKGG